MLAGGQRKAKKYGDGAFDRMLTSLIVELLDFAAKSETRKIERHADLSGCNCCYCIESLQTTAKTLLEPHIELLEKQNKKRKREAYLAQAPERKKQRQARQEQRKDEEEAKKKRKEDREFEKAAKAEEQALLAAERESRRCDSCSNIPPKRLYPCKSCGQKWCYSCLKASVPPRTRGLSKILEGDTWDCCQRKPPRGQEENPRLNSQEINRSQQSTLVGVPQNCCFTECFHRQLWGTLLPPRSRTSRQNKPVIGRLEFGHRCPNSRLPITGFF